MAWNCLIKNDKSATVIILLRNIDRASKVTALICRGMQARQFLGWNTMIAIKNPGVELFEFSTSWLFSYSVELQLGILFDWASNI